MMTPMLASDGDVYDARCVTIRDIDRFGHDNDIPRREGESSNQYLRRLGNCILELTMLKREIIIEALDQLEFKDNPDHVSVQTVQRALNRPRK